MPRLPTRPTLMHTLVVLACLGWAALFSPGAASAATPARPNVLLLLADDMGWGDLQCHGNDKISTPALDRIRAQSVELDHFYVSPSCSPTRSSLLSGRHHLRLRVLSTSDGLEVMHGDETTLAEALKAGGYATGCFGKWHNGSNPPSTARGQGFDEFLGFSGGFFSNYFDPTLEHNGAATPTRGFITDVLTDGALRFIEQHSTRPFFCYVPFNACHSPMQAPDALFEKYSVLGFSPKDAAIYAMIENLDQNIGRLLEKIDSLGIAENTIVLFASDNGPASARFNGGMRGQKGSLFEGGQRVPCFIRWPGKLTAGRRVTEIAQHIDILPTLLDLAGLPAPNARPLDGLSLVSLLKGTATAWPPRTLFEIRGAGGKNGTVLPVFPGTARTPTHRWVHDGQKALLFDLRNDPGETHNIAENAPELAAQIQADYLAWFRSATAETHGQIQRFPICLTEGTTLFIPESDRSGGARLFGRGWDYDWAVFPKPGLSLLWNLEVPVAGRYELSALHTARTLGGQIMARVGSNQTSVKITAVVDPPVIPRPERIPRWEVPEKVFAPLPIGILEIPRGAQRLELTADPGTEIQGLTLKRLQ